MALPRFDHLWPARFPPVSKSFGEVVYILIMITCNNRLAILGRFSTETVAIAVVCYKIDLWYNLSRGPGLLATFLGALASARFLLPPRNELAVEGAENRAGMVVYLAVSIGITLLGGALH